MEQYFTNNDNLVSNIKEIKYNYNNYKFSFYTDNGVFSKDRIDKASKMLVEVFIKNSVDNKELLDVGCGYGYIGIVLSKVKNLDVDMVDINKRAIHLCKRNIDVNKVNSRVFESNTYENIVKKYDYIVSNPPIRAGKSIVLDILKGALNYLKDDGELWFVINKNQGAKSIKKELDNYYNIDILEKNNGFYVFRAKIH